MPSAIPDSTVRSWRREFEITRGVTFLNHASFGPVPRRGRQAVERLLHRQGCIPRDPNVDDETFATVAAAKRGFARLVGEQTARVSFAPNASYGLNAVLWGTRLKRGERILVPESEFPAVVYTVRHLAERLDLTVVPIPCPDGYFTAGALRRQLRRKSAILACSWVQYFNGYRYDLRELTGLCHAHGCLVLVDGTQGIGAIPMHMRRDGFDAVVCGAQKWLFGQTGAGFFAIAPDPVRRVEPLYSGWLAYDWGYRFEDLQHWDRPAYDDGRQWEVGTYPFYSVRLAEAGVALINRCGIENVWRHLQDLIGRLAEGLSGTRYEARRFPEPIHRSAIVAVGGPQTAGLYRHLWGRRIYVSLREGNIRVSPHLYNTRAEIDRLVEEIRRYDRAR
ncbi:MAG: aminotransferase class V-fold PLP-dependent enzyme [Candidatus Zixiibacteriota bacterium]